MTPELTDEQAQQFIDNSQPDISLSMTPQDHAALLELADGGARGILAQLIQQPNSLEQIHEVSGKMLAIVRAAQPSK